MYFIIFTFFFAKNCVLAKFHDLFNSKLYDLCEYTDGAFKPTRECTQNRKMRLYDRTT